MYASKFPTERSPVAKCVTIAEANTDAPLSPRVGGRKKGKVRNAETELTGKKESYNIRTTVQERKKAMTTGKALNGKPYAGNPHVRFDEGEVASAATPRRGALLYKLPKTSEIRGAKGTSAISACTASGDCCIMCAMRPVATYTHDFPSMRNEDCVYVDFAAVGCGGAETKTNTNKRSMEMHNCKNTARIGGGSQP